MIAIDRPFSPELIGRFEADIAMLWPEGQRLGIAVSGGPDSMALLALCHALRPGDIEAASVDHRLRVDSAAEAALVAQHCMRLGVPHHILPVTLADGNIQQEARIARYTALAGWMDRRGLDCIATAHHADDQAETLLLRLNRGSGIAGLAGVRRDGLIPVAGLKSRERGRLIRPLLSWRKAELVAAAKAAAMDFVEDPSNADPAYDRARLRSNLAQSNWLNIAAIADSAAHLAQADTAIEWMVEQEWAGRVRRIGTHYVYRPLAPRIIRLGIVVKLLGKLGGKAPRGSMVSRLLDRLEAGEGGNAAGVLVTILGDAWRFKKEPPRQSPTPEAK